VTITASIDVDRTRVLGEIDERIYGFLLEHIGRVVYGGVFDPGHPEAGENGLRRDVLEAVRQLRPSVIRWPGGNFASGYHWRDGVGQQADRLARHDLAWDAIETNRFGTEEFLSFCRAVGAEPYVNLNASTGTFDEAQEWVQYCNSEAPLPEVLIRHAGPHPQPHRVRLFGIGNENYGFWQHLHTTADRYAELAREWGKLLHWTDPEIELIVVGSDDPDWNWTVLTEAGNVIDHLSIHQYWNLSDDDPYHSVITGPNASEALLEDVWSMALTAQKELSLPRPVSIAVDEWGVWTNTFTPVLATSKREMVRREIPAQTEIDNSFEEVYDLKDALAVATWFHVMWRHPDRIRLANLAQLVNTLAPILIRDGVLIRQTIFHPFALARAHAHSQALDLQVQVDEGITAPSGSVAVLDAGGTVDPESGHVHLSLVNRHLSEELVVTLKGVSGPARMVVLHDDDPFATNTARHPDRVVPTTHIIELTGPIVLKPHSHTTITTRT